MKITGNDRLNITRIYNNNKLKGSSNEGRVSGGFDSVKISKEGTEIAKYVSMAKELPDERIKQIEDIKARINDGTYKVSSDELASRLLQVINGEDV